MEDQIPAACLQFSLLTKIKTKRKTNKQAYQELLLSITAVLSLCHMLHLDTWEHTTVTTVTTTTPHSHP